MSSIEAPSNHREICHRCTELVRNNPQQSKAIETKRLDPAITEVDPSEKSRRKKKPPSEHAKSRLPRYTVGHETQAQAPFSEADRVNG
jgi:hypothetical protein